MQIHPQLTTRKLLLVGHSQGALYSNALYDYLVDNGEPESAVGVYQVGSPASYVAGGGAYLNSSGDFLLGTLRDLGFKFLPNNVDLVSYGDDARKIFYGHSFSGAYLAEAPDRIVGDMQGALKKLKADSSSDTGECFTAPAAGLGYKATKAGFAVVDTAAIGIRAGAGVASRVAIAAGNALAFAAQSAYGIVSKVVADISITVGGIEGISHAAEPAKAKTNFSLVSKFYGSSIPEEEYDELMGNMGGAVATAPIFAAAPSPAPAPATQPAPVQQLASAPQASILPVTAIMPLLSGSGGARHRRSSSKAPEPEVSEPETLGTTPTVDAAPATQGAATTTMTAPSSTATGEATTTPTTGTATSTPEAPAPAYTLAFEDTFDSFNSKGWLTPAGIYSGNLIPFELEPADSGLCHAGSCITGKGAESGLGTAPRIPYIDRRVGESSAGYLTVWARRHDGLRAVSARAFACVAGTECARAYAINLSAPNDDQWHQHLFAWRTTPEGLWLCGQMDVLDVQSCAWSDTYESNPPEAFDGIALWGFAPRTDYGDRILFDDIEVYLMP